MTDMAFEVEMAAPFDQALEQVIDALKAEGFGVLTRIDVHDTFREKLDREFHPYCILGACNPVLAHKALSHRPEVGLMLPCNVVVEQTDGGIRVRIIDPAEMMQMGGFDGDAVLQEVGSEAEARLRRVAEQLKQ